MAEPGEPYYELVAPDPATGKDRTYTLFSSSGKPLSKDAYGKAIEIHNATGKMPPGFMLFPGGADEKPDYSAMLRPQAAPAPTTAPTGARGIFETVIGGPARALAEKAEQSPSMPDVPVIAPVANYLGKKLAPDLIRSVSTPRGALNTAANLALTYGTGGLTTVPAMLRIGVGGVVSDLVGQYLDGESFNLGKNAMEAVTEGGLMAVGRGIQGAIEYVAGRGIGSRAVARAKDDLTKIAEQEYKHLTGDPNLLTFAATSKEGFQKMTNRLVGNMRQAAADLATETKTTVRSALPALVPDPKDSTKMVQALSTKDRDHLTRTLTGAFTRLSNAGEDVMEHAGNTMKYQSALDKVKSAGEEIVQVILDKFPNDLSYAQAASNALEQHVQKLSYHKGTMEYVRALERAGAQKGFDAAAIRREMTRYAQADPASHLAQAAEIAGKAVGTPSTLGIGALQTPFPRPFNRLPLSKQVGMRYPHPGMADATTTALGSTGAAAVAGTVLGGSQAMESFTGGKR